MSGPMLILFLLWTLVSGLALMVFRLMRTPVRAWRKARQGLR
jgi:hypothetical protein